MPTICHKFPAPIVMISDVLFCPTESTKPIIAQFIIKKDKETQKIFTFEELESLNVCHFAQNINQFLKLLPINFLSIDKSTSPFSPISLCSFMYLMIN